MVDCGILTEIALTIGKTSAYNCKVMMDASAKIPLELIELRQSIDNIDTALIYMLAERFKFTHRVGELKAELGLPPADPQREAIQIARLRQLAINANLDAIFAEKFLKFIIAEVIRNHDGIKRIKP